MVYTPPRRAAAAACVFSFKPSRARTISSWNSVCLDSVLWTLGSASLRISASTRMRHFSECFVPSLALPDLICRHRRHPSVYLNLSRSGLVILGRRRARTSGSFGLGPQRRRWSSGRGGRTRGAASSVGSGVKFRGVPVVASIASAFHLPSRGLRLTA